MNQNKGLSIGQIADRTGLAVSAIRFYEEKRLISPDRNHGGQRSYQRADLRRLSFVMISQKLGFTLAEIRELLAGLPDNRTPTKADWTKIGRRFRHEIDARISGLNELGNRLDGCIGCGCLSLKSCSLYNPKDIAAIKGAGPRYLVGDRPR